MSIKDILDKARSNGVLVTLPSIVESGQHGVIFLSGHLTSTSQALVELVDRYYEVVSIQTYVVGADTTKLSALLRSK